MSIDGLSEERQRTLTEILLASLAMNPEFLSKIMFIGKDDVHPDYLSLFRALSFSGQVDKNQFEKIYRNGSESLKELLFNYKDVSPEQFVSMAKILWGVSQRIKLRRLLRDIDSRLDSLDHNEIKNKISELSTAISSPVDNQKSGDQITHSGIDVMSLQFPEIDYQIGGGLSKKDYWILAARPSVGKTSLSLNIALRLLLTGKSVAYDTLEMPPIDLVMRMAAAFGCIDIQHAIKMCPTPEEELRLGLSMARLVPHLQRFFPLEESNPLGLAAKIDLIRPDIVFVDHIGLMSYQGNTKEEKISEISRILKKMSSIAPVCGISQLNRAIEKRQEQIPILSDLRDSGALEQDADIVTFLHRPSQVGIQGYKPFEVVLDIAKQRNGPTSQITLKNIPEIGLFI